MQWLALSPLLIPFSLFPSLSSSFHIVLQGVRATLISLFMKAFFVFFEPPATHTSVLFVFLTYDYIKVFNLSHWSSVFNCVYFWKIWTKNQQEKDVYSNLVCSVWMHSQSPCLPLPGVAPHTHTLSIPPSLPFHCRSPSFPLSPPLFLYICPLILGSAEKLLKSPMKYVWRIVSHAIGPIYWTAERMNSHTG